MPNLETDIPSEEVREIKDVCLVSGSTYPALADEIANFMGIEVDPIEHIQFPNTEVYSRYLESVRGKHVVLIQSLSARPKWSVNDGLVQLALMANAARGASAAKITAAVPYLAYARQDRKSKGREPLSAQAILDILAVCGVNRVVTVDPHSPQVQLGFRGPVDQLVAEPLLQEELRQDIESHDGDYLVIAPDVGRVAVAQHYSDNLTEVTKSNRGGRLVGFDFMSKKRLPGNKVVHQPPRAVKGMNCLVIDDMIDTAGTLVSATDALREAGAERIVVAATHGLFSAAALKRIKGSVIERVIVTDTVRMDKAQKVLGSDRLKVLSIAPLIGQALVEIVTDGSVSRLFEGYKQFA
jgi:ribose-phosphate pyrophosphokinase